MAQPGVNVFHVSDEQANQTLAALLRQWHPKQSWSNVRRWVENRRVEVDGNVSLEPIVG